jgi:hypothetical protein
MKPCPGQHVILELMKLGDEIIKQFGNHVCLGLHWISGHSGVEGNELVNVKAKKAAQSNSSEACLLPSFLTNFVLGHSIA